MSIFLSFDTVDHLAVMDSAHERQKEERCLLYHKRGPDDAGEISVPLTSSPSSSTLHSLAIWNSV
jgi:hypothetical protein